MGRMSALCKWDKFRAGGNMGYDSLSLLIRNQIELWIVPRDRLAEPNGVEFTGLRNLGPDELPERILSRRKGGHVLRIS